MADSDPYANWSLSDRVQMLAFEAELGYLPRFLISTIWVALKRLHLLGSQRPAQLRSRRS